MRFLSLSLGAGVLGLAFFLSGCAGEDNPTPPADNPGETASGVEAMQKIGPPMTTKENMEAAKKK